MRLATSSESNCARYRKSSIRLLPATAFEGRMVLMCRRESECSSKSQDLRLVSSDPVTRIFFCGRYSTLVMKSE